jgi:transcriptional regulator with XRE-family HTH domain
MTPPIICTLTAEELEGYAAAMEEAAARLAALDARAPDLAAPLARDWALDRAALARAMIANSDAVEDAPAEPDDVTAEEAAQDGLADAVAEHSGAGGGFSAGPCKRVAPSAPAPESGQPPRRGRTEERLAALVATIRAAAEAGRPCPTNAELATACGIGNLPRVSELLATAAARGMVVVTPIGGNAREVAAGDGSWRTAPPPAQPASPASLANLHLGREPSMPREEQERIAERARTVMAARGMTLQAAAAEIGIPLGSYGPWLRRQSVSSGTAERVRAWADAQPQPEPEDPMADPELDAADETAARQMLAVGQGAKDLAQHFGGGVEWWQAWCAAARRQQRGAA